MWSSFLLLLVVIVYNITLTSSSDSTASPSVYFPEPNTANNKILGLVLTYNYDHIDPLLFIIDEYLSICESGWLPTIVIFSIAAWPDKMRRYINSKTYCYRIGANFNVQYSLHPPNISIALGAEHRKVLRKELNNYDLFIYHEDDIVLKHSHIAAYMNETKHIYKTDGIEGLKSNCIGFQRYRKIFRGGDIHNAAWNEQDMYEQELFEEMPKFRPICYGNIPYLRVEGNLHQAIWMLTRSQILLLHEKCSFLDQYSASREHMSSFFLYSSPCNMNKLIPAATLTSFMILHFYQQRHISWTPVFSGFENIVAGREYSAGGDGGEMPKECWGPLVSKSIALQKVDAP